MKYIIILLLFANIVIAQNKPVIEYYPHGLQINKLAITETFLAPSFNNIKVYRALITQSDTSDPTVIILENSLGVIQWIRQDTGTYNGVLTESFTDSATYFSGGIIDVNNAAAFTTDITTNYVVIKTGYIGNPAKYDGILDETEIEIRVYPK